jgi:flagellar export protein FliJ
MRKFHFPLDSVLRWRETAVSQEEAKLRRLFREDQRIALAIEQTRAEGAAAEQDIRRQREMVSTDLRSLAAFRLRVEENLDRLAQRRTQQAALIEKQRQALLEAERQFQLLVKLKERRHAEWTYEAGRETENFAQESFLGRWSAGKRLAAAHIPKLKE